MDNYSATQILNEIRLAKIYDYLPVLIGNIKLISLMIRFGNRAFLRV